jgi:hypothetical protein
MLLADLASYTTPLDDLGMLDHRSTHNPEVLWTGPLWLCQDPGKLAMVIWPCAGLIYDIPHKACTSTWQADAQCTSVTWTQVKGRVLWVNVFFLKASSVSSACALI